MIKQSRHKSKYWPLCSNLKLLSLVNASMGLLLGFVSDLVSGLVLGLVLGLVSGLVSG